MSTIKKQIHLYAVWEEYKRKWNYYAADVAHEAMNKEGWVLIESKFIEFDRPGPDADWSAGAIELTRKEQARIRAEAQAKCNVLDDRINSMLAIECKVEA